MAGVPNSRQSSPRELVVRDIVRGLYEGRYQPGQRLVENKLTAAYGISRGPVREALNRLAATGVVVLSSQRGASVRCLTIQEGVDILIVSEGLIGIAVKLAAERIAQPGAAAKMRHALERVVNFDLSDGEADYANVRSQFYATISQIAGNSELTRILPGMQIHIVRVQFRAILQMAHEIRRADYQRIGTAVLAGKPIEARSAVRTHFGRAIKALRAAMPQ